MVENPFSRGKPEYHVRSYLVRENCTVAFHNTFLARGLYVLEPPIESSENEQTGRWVQDE